MNNYEILYIVTIKTTEKEQKEVSDKVKKIVEENGGKISNEEGLGKKKLAFTIKKARHGFYNLIEFEIEPAKIKEIDSKIKLVDSVLRHIIVKQDLEKIKEAKKKKEEAEKTANADYAKVQSQRSQNVIAKTAKSTIAKSVKESTEVTQKKKKMDLKELDKKIDKILDEDIIK